MGLENKILYNLVDVLTGRCRLKQALIRDKRYPNLSMIPSACIKERISLGGAQMKRLTEELKEEFDYVLIDSPAGIDDGFELAIATADKIVVVTTPQVAAVHDADCVLRLLKKQKCITPYLLINAFNRQMAKEGNMLRVEDICKLLETELLGVVLEDEQIMIAQNHGNPVFGKKFVSDACYRNICRRLTGEEIPIPDYLKENRILGHFFWRRAEAGRIEA